MKPTDNRADAVRAEVFEGVFRYIDEMYNSFGPEIFSVKFSPATAQQPFAQVLSGCWKVSTELVNIIKVEDDFCGNGTIDVFSQYLRQY